MTRSIRKQLIVWLLSMLGTIYLARMWYGYYQALEIANSDYDEQLLNSADSVAARLQVNQSAYAINLPVDTLKMFTHNNADLFYYEVLDSNGKRIVGNTSSLKPQLNPQLLANPYFKTITLNHEACRFLQARILVPEVELKSVTVLCAETLHTRVNLTNRIVANIAWAQMLVILASALAVLIAINSVFVPISKLCQSILKRSVNDLSPIDETTTPSEVQPLIEAINDLLARSREEIESRSRFLANAAHQLRTPIAGLKTYSSMTSELTRVNDFRRVVNKLDSGLDRLTHLVNQLLALTRVERASLAPIDLRSIVSEVKAEFVELALGKEISLEFVSAAEAAVVSGDKFGLRQLTANLLENAIQYSQAESKVTVGVFSIEDGVLLAVENYGPEIPVAERERIFERFYRLPGSIGNGCGLGLSIVKEVAVAHKATITIDLPREGVGTLFTVVFPKLGSS